MYKIEKTVYGFKLTFEGFIKTEEMKQWIEESKKVLANKTGKFGIFVDMRNLKPLPSDAQQLMVEGQSVYKQKGMERSVVIVDSSILAGQFKRLALSSGIYKWERYIDASSNHDFEKKGEDWIKSGIDPDK